MHVETGRKIKKFRFELQFCGQPEEEPMETKQNKTNNNNKIETVQTKIALKGNSKYIW